LRELEIQDWLVDEKVTALRIKKGNLGRTFSQRPGGADEHMNVEHLILVACFFE